MSKPGASKGVGQRREILILLPVSLMILVLLSTFALQAYRSTVDLLVEERQAEAERLARQLAGQLDAAGVPTADELRRGFPIAAAVAILDQEGSVLVATGAPPVAAPGFWRGAPREASVRGIARIRRGDRTLTAAVDLPAAVLRSRQHSLRILAPVLLSVNGAVTVLVLFFLRRFLAPFEGLLERARDAGQEVPERDEVVFLVETFDRALAALADRGEVDELEALEGALSQSLESGVLLCDAAGSVVTLNEIGAALLEIEPPSPGQALETVLGRHRELSQLLRGAVRREQTVQRRECTLVGSRGERTLGVTAHPLRRDDHEVRGFLVMFADLTEAQKEMKQRQLVDSLSQLGELTAGVAHEMRNGLATLRGYLTLIDRDPKQESILDYLSEMRRESDHLERVLEDFLTFARPGSVRPREVDLAALVRRSSSDPALGEAAVELIEPAEPGELSVQGDAQLLERAVRNLLSNAVEAQREAGAADPVEVRVEAAGEGVEVLVLDRGPGLSEQAREKLFDPFFTERPGGVGMGLALTRRIVLLHSGRVRLEDRRGGGTRASMWLPGGKVVTQGNSMS